MRILRNENETPRESVKAHREYVKARVWSHCQARLSIYIDRVTLIGKGICGKVATQLAYETCYCTPTAVNRNVGM